MKRVIAAQVEGNARIAPDIYQLTLSLPDAEAEAFAAAISDAGSS